MKQSWFRVAQTPPQRWRARYIAAFAGACLGLLPVGVRAHDYRRPTVPPDLEVSAEHKLFLVGHAVGTQNYVCLGSVGGVGLWAQFGPQATLFDDRDQQIVTHFLSEDPDEEDTLRPTWQHSRDTSAVWAAQVAISSDSAWVEPGAIPWLKLEVKTARLGPTGGGRLADTTYIQRVHTSGGLKPTTDCLLGDRKLVPYSTDYYFYKAR